MNSERQEHKEERGESGERPTTIEQDDIINYIPNPGEIVRISARAGAGKTTTAQMIAAAAVKRDPSARVGYFVFNAEASRDAQAREGFMANTRVQVATTHAFAQRKIWPNFDDNRESGDGVKFSLNSGAVVVRLQLRSMVESRFKLALRALTSPDSGVNPSDVLDLTEMDINDETSRKKLMGNIALGFRRRGLLGKRLSCVASFIIRTMERFCTFGSPTPEPFHVVRDATDFGTSGKAGWKRCFPEAFYTEAAGVLFALCQLLNIGPGSTVFPECTVFDIAAVRKYHELSGSQKPGLGIPHDCYLKVFQLRRLPIDNLSARLCTTCNDRYMELRTKRWQTGSENFWHCRKCERSAAPGLDVVIMDEAQDLTEAQNLAFWQDEQVRGRAVVWLVGDQRQRIYGWRQASRTFERATVGPSQSANPRIPPLSKDLPLSHSFRFGRNIAAVAQRILSLTPPGGDVFNITGRARYTGDVRRGFGSPGPCVLITRTNAGLVTALREMQQRRSCKTFPQWSAIGDKVTGRLEPRNMRRLAAFHAATKDIRTPDLEAEVENLGEQELAELCDVHSDDERPDASHDSQTRQAPETGWTADTTGPAPTPVPPPGSASGPSCTYTLEGDVFHTWTELKEHVEEMGLVEEAAMIELVEDYSGYTAASGATGIVALLEDLNKKKVPDRSGVEVRWVTTHRAKGSEFTEKVFLANDWGKCLESFTIEEAAFRSPQRKNITETLNLLYVAVTRAARCLHLSEPVWQFLHQLGQEEEGGEYDDDGAANDCGAGGSKLRTGNRRWAQHTPEQLQVLRERYAENWSKFDQKYPEGGAVTGVPLVEIAWPPLLDVSAGSDKDFLDVFALGHDADQKDLLEHSKIAALRYHPDKLQTRVLVAEEDEAEFRAHVGRMIEVRKWLRDAAAEPDGPDGVRGPSVVPGDSDAAGSGKRPRSSDGDDGPTSKRPAHRE